MSEYVINEANEADGSLQETRRQVESAIRRRTAGQIRNLVVTVEGDELVISGSTFTYYAKAIANNAALDACDSDILFRNEIEVK